MNRIVPIAMFSLCAKGCLESLFAYLAEKWPESVFSRVTTVVSKTFRNVEIIGIYYHLALMFSANLTQSLLTVFFNRSVG